MLEFMTVTLDKILLEANELDADERAELALKLIESLDSAEPAEEVERAWNAEAVRQLAAYDAGETATVSAEELHASILADLQAR
jgi:putative addiction module component (TIGR02574 family)